MNLILQDEKKQKMATLVIPDNSHITEKIIYPYPCLDCVKTHDAYFVHVGMHDDGEIYRLERIHQ